MVPASCSEAVNDRGMGKEAGQGCRAVSRAREAADGEEVAQQHLSCSDSRERRELVGLDHPDLSISRPSAVPALP